MNEDVFENVSWLIDAIAKGLKARGGAPANEVLGRLAEQDLGAKSFVEPLSQRLPVTRYFAEAIAETMMLEPDMAAALAALDGHFNWRQNTSYTDEALGEGFFKNYGWCQIVGPRGFFKGEDFLLGLLMLGPNRHYRDHYHPAPELYWPLTGPAQWKQGQGGFETKQAGDIIWHASNVLHATKTDDRPMLAVWSWASDTHVPAKLADL
jgi:Dimethlysulfonioproprionate lyase